MKAKKKSGKKLKPKDAADFVGGGGDDKPGTTANGVGILSKTLFASLDVCEVSLPPPTREHRVRLLRGEDARCVLMNIHRGPRVGTAPGAVTLQEC